MARIVNTIPQSLTAVAHVSLDQVIAAIPDNIPFTETIGISGRIRDGKQMGNVTFQAMMDEEPTAEMKSYFAAIVESATGGQFTATVMNQWRRSDIKPMWLCANGRKIIGNDLRYTELPPAVELPLEITKEFVLSRMPETIPFTVTLWATGGIVREGRSTKDFDIIAGTAIEVNGAVQITETVSPTVCKQIKTFFSDILSVDTKIHVDVGNVIMSEREPVYLCKLYENGVLVYGG